MAVELRPTTELLGPPADVNPSAVAFLGVGSDGRAQALAVAA